MAHFEIHGLQIQVPDAVLTPVLRRSLHKGWYEADEVAIISAKIRPGDRVLEMGAGLGVTALVAARIVGPEAVAPFEANPALIAIATRNAALNDIGIDFKNQVLFPSRILPSEGKVNFGVSESFWSSSIDEVENVIEVAASSLEAAIESFGANVLVMDIEGMEVPVLEQAELDGVQKLIFEIHYDRQGRARTNAAIESAVSRGFSIDFETSRRGVLFLDRD